MKTLRIAAAIVAALIGGDALAQDSTHALDWSLIYARPATGKYEGISFPDQAHGWVVTARGDILATADGGATWTSQANGLNGLRSVHFLDRTHGFAGTLTGRLYAGLPKGHVALYCGMGSSSLKEEVKAFERLPIVRGLNSSCRGLR